MLDRLNSSQLIPIANEQTNALIPPPEMAHAAKDVEAPSSIDTVSKNLTERAVRIIQNSPKRPSSLLPQINLLNRGTGSHQKALAQVIRDELSKQNTPTYYLYSSGGGGHIAAKNALVEEHWKKVYDAVCLRYAAESPARVEPSLRTFDTFLTYCKRAGLYKENDVLHDFLGKVGEWCSASWDKAQEAGDVKKQERLASMQSISDTVFAAPIFTATLFNLMRHRPKVIVSTQAMATPAILLAIKVYNRFVVSKNERASLNLYMTDMPTKHSGHFFNSLKRLKLTGGHKNLVLFAPKPEKPVDWTKLCGLKPKRVVELETLKLPVRAAFLDAVDSYHPAAGSAAVELKVSGPTEAALLSDVLQHQQAPFVPPAASAAGPFTFNYPIDGAGDNQFIMLGSRPTRQAIFDYVDEALEEAKANPSAPITRFIFCGKFDNSGQQNCLYAELCSYIKTKDGWPSNLAVVPLSFQDPKQLVTLMMNCDTKSRSGGASVMELLVIEAARRRHNLPARKRYIHVQRVKGRKTLTDSIVKWERGNFFFLRDALGEDVVKAVEPQKP